LAMACCRRCSAPTWLDLDVVKVAGRRTSSRRMCVPPGTGL
jgi:hypothetical protein